MGKQTLRREERVFWDLALGWSQRGASALNEVTTTEEYGPALTTGYVNSVTARAPILAVLLAGGGAA